MTTPNPAHAAVIKITDRDGNVKYLHYQNGWVCHLDNGQAASLTFAGISDKQVQACKFALAQCQHPAQVLAAVRRYAAGNCIYELESLLEGTEVSPPSLKDRLTALIGEARDAGYAVVLFNPDELIGVSCDDLEQHLVMEGNTFIDDTREPDEDEEE